MQIRNILLTVFSVIAICSLISYTACKNDPCQNVICLNLGACENGTCVCPTGFEGQRCEIYSRDKFIKTFNGHDTCDYTTRDTTIYKSYPVYFRAIPEDPRSMTMWNLLHNMEDSAICTMLGVDSFSFQGSNNATNFIGKGRMSHDSLWLDYHVEQDTSGYDCRFFGQGLR